MIEAFGATKIFSSRELALAVWLCLGLGYLGCSKKFSPYVKQILRAFCSKYIVIPIASLGAAVVAISYFLIELGFWNFNQYKNVTLWFLCVGIYSLFQVAGVNKGGRYFSKTVVEIFKITTVFEFVITFYSFNFWFELVFIPFITLIFLMSAFSENKDEYKLVHGFFNWVIAAVGYLIILYVSYLLISTPDEFLSEGTVYDFFVPIILTIGIFPYLYLVMMYAEYQRFFVRLKMNFKDDELETYAKCKSLINFNIHISHLKRWDRYILFHEVKTKTDIDESIDRVKYLLKRDKKNTPVEFDDGWSHYEARRYLKEYKLMTSYYDHLYYDSWGAHSETLKLGEGFFCNKFTYHIDGDEAAVKCLTLVLDVQEPEKFDEALDEFRKISNSLFSKAVNEDKTLTIDTEEVEGSESELYQTQVVELEGRQVMMQKRKHVNRETFELRLSLAVDKESFRFSESV